MSRWRSTHPLSTPPSAVRAPADLDAVEAIVRDAGT